MTTDVPSHTECATFDDCGGILKLKALTTPTGWVIERFRQAPPADVFLVSTDFAMEHCDGELYYFAFCYHGASFYVKIHYYGMMDWVPAFPEVVAAMHAQHHLAVKAPSLCALTEDGHWQELGDEPSDIHFCRHNGTEAYRKEVLFTLLLGGSRRKKNRLPSSLYNHFKKGAPFAERRVLSLVLDFVAQPYTAPLAYHTE